jgi:integrase
LTRHQLPCAGGGGLCRPALAALERLRRRIDTPRLFAAKSGAVLNESHFQTREWGPAVEASGIARPARIYDLRSTFASRALAAGQPAFIVAKIMGTSVAMIERHYGALLDGSMSAIADALDAADAAR